MRREWLLSLLSEVREEHKKFLQIVCDDIERRFREGDKRALLRMIFMHIRWGQALPTWARDAFVEAVSFQPKCWDDVFGKPDGKGAQRKEEVKAFYVASDHPEKRHDELFEEIANKIRKSVGTAKRCYYSETREDLEAGEDALNYLRKEYRLSVEELREWQNEIDYLVGCILAEQRSSQKAVED